MSVEVEVDIGEEPLSVKEFNCHEFNQLINSSDLLDLINTINWQGIETLNVKANILVSLIPFQDPRFSCLQLV